MPAEGRENPLLKKGNSDAFFREKYLTKNTTLLSYIPKEIFTNESCPVSPSCPDIPAGLFPVLSLSVQS